MFVYKYDNLHIIRYTIRKSKYINKKTLTSKAEQSNVALHSSDKKWYTSDEYFVYIIQTVAPYIGYLLHRLDNTVLDESIKDILLQAHIAQTKHEDLSDFIAQYEKELYGKLLDFSISLFVDEFSDPKRVEKKGTEVLCALINDCSNENPQDSYIRILTHVYHKLQQILSQREIVYQIEDNNNTLLENIVYDVITEQISVWNNEHKDFSHSYPVHCIIVRGSLPSYTFKSDSDVDIHIVFEEPEFEFADRDIMASDSKKLVERIKKGFIHSPLKDYIPHLDVDNMTDSMGGMFSTQLWFADTTYVHNLPSWHEKVYVVGKPLGIEKYDSAIIKK